MSLNIKTIWVPEFADSLEECIFFAVEITEGDDLSTDVYSALFFHKLVAMIDDSRDDDLLEDIDCMFPSLYLSDLCDDDLSNEDIALQVVEAKEFFFGFPPIQEEYVKCLRLDEIAKKGIDGFDYDEFIGSFEEDYNFSTIMTFVTEASDSCLASNSEHVQDTDLYMKLFNPPTNKGKK